MVIELYIMPDPYRDARKRHHRLSQKQKKRTVISHHIEQVYLSFIVANTLDVPKKQPHQLIFEELGCALERVFMPSTPLSNLLLTFLFFS